MAFLQTHDWGLKVLQATRGLYKFPSPTTSSHRWGIMNDRSSAVLREFTVLQVLWKCLDTLYWSFCTFYKRVICISKPQEIWKSPGD